ncbi:MAG TPA: bifunctional DNA primase/polymerase [Actinomycetota bacterium]|nr:bifunctional DNA primase/polymerase [Actinomycetota bacterium]
MTAPNAGGEADASPPASLLQAASYVALGLSPFPVEPRGKKPAVQWKRFVGRRLIDELSFEELDRYVCAWWDRPDPYNIGVPCGVPVYVDEEHTAPLLVVDVDDDAARLRVEAEVGWPIQTPTVRTAKGFHLWFTHEEAVGNRAKVQGVGLDVRGLGGYVLAPPSLHPSGAAYEWVVSPADLWPPPPLPERLRDLIWPPRERPPRTLLLPRRGGRSRYAEAALRREAEAVAAAPQGTRNDTLNKAAYALARFVRTGELSATEVGEALLRAAVAAGLPEREAERTILSGLRGRGT